VAVLLEVCEAADDEALAALVQAEGPLAPWLTASPGDALPEALMLALRLWPRLPPAVAARCPLLPAAAKQGGSEPLARNVWADPSAAAKSGAFAEASARFFSRQHLEALLPVLRATTQAHPRLHSLWPTLLALLMPGFSADKVRKACPRQTCVADQPSTRQCLGSEPACGSLAGRLSCVPALGASLDAALV
jgi:DNA polymerase phi